MKHWSLAKAQISRHAI